MTGLPRSTVRDWHLGYARGWRNRSPNDCPLHDLAPLDGEAYAYLFGVYLGDGCLSLHRRGVWKLRITLDANHPGIIGECAAAVRAVRPCKRVGVWYRRDQRTAEVSSYWKHWLCLLPQHGRGPKHLRRIELERWQEDFVHAHPRPFLRGLIHSDGTRIIATERKGTHVRHAPRYAFSNRSEDILQLFAAACRRVGVHFTRASNHQIAIYSKGAVALLDEFIGPKR
jgi:hypothetical protein